MSRLFTLVAAAMLASTVTGPAGAAPRHVSYADLDLTTEAGRTAIDDRIRTAASQLCMRQNRDLTQATACRRDSIAQALADLDRQLASAPVQLAAR